LNYRRRAEPFLNLIELKRSRQRLLDVDEYAKEAAGEIIVKLIR
jgi:hypothetical protein